MRQNTRRQFLQSAAGAVAVYELGRHLPGPLESIPVASADALPTVAVSKGANTDSAETILRTALDGLGGIGRFVKPGQTVAIKPNATWAYPPGTASSTDPDLLRALILMVKNAGARRVIVMDHCSIDPGTAECLRASGIGAVVDKLGVDKIFPDRYLSPKELYTQIDLPKGKAFQKLGVIKAAAEADVRINMAVAKSHVVTKLTMCLKHMMGFLELPNSLHAQLEQGIADINSPSPIQAQLHILEAIRVRLPVGAKRQAGGDETEKTHPEKIKRLNQIVAGTDPVLMDAFGCVSYFSFKPQELTHLKRAWESGLGEIDVDKATREGRLRVFTAGQPVVTPTPILQATATQPAAFAPAMLTVPIPTNTPLSVADRGGAVSGPEASTPRESADVIDPRPFLSGALIPAAAILAGLGIVARRLMRQDKE